MDVGDWVTIVGGLVGLIVQSIGVAVFITRVSAQAQANTEAIKALAANAVTRSEGQGYQAQLDRLEKKDAECEGKLTATRQELSDRIERHGAALTLAEHNRTAESSVLAGVLGELKASMASMQKSMDGVIEAERARLATPPPASNNMLDQLQLFVGVTKMLRELSPNAASVGAAH